MDCRSDMCVSTVNMRAKVEGKVAAELSRHATPIYDWMYDLDLTPTQLKVYSYLFEQLRHNCLQEIVLSSSSVSRKMRITQAQFNLIVRELNKLGLIFRRVEGKGCSAKAYYSLYQNLFSNEPNIDKEPNK